MLDCEYICVLLISFEMLCLLLVLWEMKVRIVGADLAQNIHQDIQGMKQFGFIYSRVAGNNKVSDELLYQQ